MLAAPDIDVLEFERDFGPKLALHSVRTTIYCSSTDLALHASYSFNDAPRVGDSSHGIVVIKDIDTIDASLMRTDLLGHSYYGDCVELAADIGVLLKTNAAPGSENRKLKQRPWESLIYWVFAKAAG